MAKKRPCGQLVVISSNTRIAATLSDFASVWMNGALQHTTEIMLDQPDEASARIFARQMYTLLIHLCEGRALAIVRGAPDHNCLEAWRPLHAWYQPKTRSRGLALLNEILGCDFGTKEQFLQRMKDWEDATTTGRGAGGRVDFSISEGGSDIPACASAGENSEIEPSTVAL